MSNRRWGGILTFTRTPTSREALWGHGLEVRSLKTPVALVGTQLSQQLWSRPELPEFSPKRQSFPKGQLAQVGGLRTRKHRWKGKELVIKSYSPFTWRG